MVRWESESEGVKSPRPAADPGGWIELHSCEPKRRGVEGVVDCGLLDLLDHIIFCVDLI